VGTYNGSVRVSDLGEFGLIRRLSLMIQNQVPDLVVGIGDDCAVWQSGSDYVLATTDTLVEGVHFEEGTTPWRDVGWKALATNVSDVAAMGGSPLFALVTLCLPSTTEVSQVDELYEGIQECASSFGVAIVGGDIVSAPHVVVTVALMGRAQMRDGIPLLMRRSSAKAGDVVAVTGTLGDSAAGLRRLREGSGAADGLAQAHVRPDPPLAVAQEAARLGVRCAIDVSDGLLQDVGHISEASKVGVDLRADDIPISEEVRSLFPAEALGMACSGGEDYQIVFAGGSGVIAALMELRPGMITIIGRVTDRVSEVRLLDRTGEEIDMSGDGWDHFRR
jgi:thiamine-monophosphate kinase